MPDSIRHPASSDHHVTWIAGQARNDSRSIAVRAAARSHPAQPQLLKSTGPAPAAAFPLPSTSCSVAKVRNIQPRLEQVAGFVNGLRRIDHYPSAGREVPA